jgi:hypothetical protein
MKCQRVELHQVTIDHLQKKVRQSTPMVSKTEDVDANSYDIQLFEDAFKL